jgi:Fic family protein
MKGVRGKEKHPGTVRTSQNWIGGSRPGNARFVPPQPEAVPGLLSELEHWIHSNDPLPPLIKAGLAHVQFETIHPFLDGNGRVGRLLITLLLIQWQLAPQPLLYLSLEFKRRQQEYYQRLDAVRTEGDWEGWTFFFLECVRDSANDGVRTARSLFTIVGKDRSAVLQHPTTSMKAVQLLELLPQHPIVTLASAMRLLGATQPTAGKAIDALCRCGVLHEITGRKRDRVFSYRNYLNVLAEQTDLPENP